ncbi:hypothetical protein QFC20_003636 [Naganishia adeliensis]|uniref:Uncharacterized protein n=1 Tax=Naganishia adeliensis TaxID=92952 RepID=A0ACC2W8U0_9TREE|nr:hypothetical protein QFC20_003636 [Naganishia adeliensis]
MARMKTSFLPSSHEKASGQRDPMLDSPRTAKHKSLRERGPLAWNIKKADQVPRRLAIKNHFVAMVGEYVGTTLFLLLALGATNVANVPTTSVTGATTAGEQGSTAAAVNTSSLLYIALAFGFSLAVNAWIFFRVSGGLFNPAVSWGMVLVGALTPLRGALLTVSQILGGITGAAIVDAITPGTLNVRTTLGGGTTIARGLFIEMFMTAMLMLAILLLAAEKHKATFLAPIGIGLALFIAELMSVYYTGGSLNPARSFGPDVVLHKFSGYHWIYWLGPWMGATLAAGFYKFIKASPEDDDEKHTADLTKAGGTGAPALVTGGGTTAPGMLGTTGRASSHTGPTLATQGAGLGDLLTHGDAVNDGAHAFDLEANNAPHYNSRLDRIEELLAQLLANRSPTATVDTATTDTRHSMGTLTNDSPLVHDKTKLLPTTVHESYPHDAGYMTRDTGFVNRDMAYDHGSDNSVASPVALSTPVDLQGLAGHISEEHIRR